MEALLNKKTNKGIKTGKKKNLIFLKTNLLRYNFFKGAQNQLGGFQHIHRVVQL